MPRALALLRKSIADREVAMLCVAAALSRGSRAGNLAIPVAPQAVKDRVEQAFNDQGSDKTSAHSYGDVYASLVHDLPGTSRVLELGIGTHFADVPNNMGESGTPGASLRAFRELFPQGEIHGADIDRRILFSEERIATHWVDQLDLTSLRALHQTIGGVASLDLVVDDGLHTKRANLNSFRALFSAVRPGGYYVVEDVDKTAIGMWRYYISRNRLTGTVIDMRTERDWRINVLAVVRA